MHCVIVADQWSILSSMLWHTQDGTFHNIEHFQFEGWTVEQLPPVTSFVGFVSEVLKGVESFNTSQKLLVHDMYVQEVFRKPLVTS